MKRMFVVLACVMALSSLSLADEKGRGLYVGIGYGNTAFDDDDFVKEEQPTVQGSLSEKSSGVKLYMGYQVNKIVGLECGYINYGSFYADDYVHKAMATSLAVNLGYTFLEGTLRPYTLLGLGYVFNNFPHNDVPSVAPNNIASHLGLGLDYTPVFASGFGLRIAFEADGYTYKIEKETPDTVKEYEQTFGMLYVGVHYKY